MRRRLQAAGLILAILVVGLGLIVIATEREVEADAGPRLLTTRDVIRVLQEHGIVIDGEYWPAHHPLLGIAGTTLTAGETSIEVYVYQSIAARVADEQIIQQHLMQLQALASGDVQPLRVTSARNVLLFIHAESSAVAASIHDAARELALVPVR